MKKSKTTSYPKPKIIIKKDQKIKEVPKNCELFTLNSENWNVHQDDRANIMGADFHQMESARSSK
ncbi:hypothetical protein [Desulfovibrio gilichinskyi]|uniref:Uncharacterized protein n=1 Tax=Desulfovibrio gilichinskyi TaxID=1519643 RepID=A0A1X7C2S1_9BACT|nr:hypothetical protein [Desulfovibrio gilichinskyi]SME88828.1 hypothetical protein SAMN06295933_0210 [Desulfovibrio gilichinskyi]